MKDKRPVNIQITSIQLPLSAIVSILHRVSGVVLFFAVGVLLYMFDLSLASKESFISLRECLSSPFIKLILLVLAAALIYHTLAGVRHLIMDLGYGESLEGGLKGAKIVLISTVVLVFITAFWII